MRGDIKIILNEKLKSLGTGWEVSELTNEITYAVFKKFSLA